MFWKVYFWFVVFLAAISVPFYMKTLRIWEIIDVLLCLTALVGLWGFAWKRLILSAKFWRLFFVTWIIWTPIYQFAIPLPAEALEVEALKISQSFLAFVSIIPAIPNFYAIYRYAFSNYIFSESADVVG